MLRRKIKQEGYMKCWRGVKKPDMVTRDEFPRKVTFSKDVKKAKVIWVSEGKAFWTMVMAPAKALRQRSFKEEQRDYCVCAQERREMWVETADHRSPGRSQLRLLYLTREMGRD